jgi:hypothetical protein
MTRMLVLAPLAGLACLVMAACGAEERPAIAPSSRPPPTAEISELEIRAHGVDRFASCPPPGELGQQWIPPLPAWSPPEATDAGAPAVVDQNFIARTADRTPTEMAVEATHRDFRSCYRKGLVRGGSQEGRVAIVLRVGADGRVANVEEYGACELDVQAIACMKSSAARLRFQPPGAGDGTIVIPAAFTSREGNRRTIGSANDAYTASAYLTLEAARPGLHACEEQARRDLKPLSATGTFVMAIAADGHVTETHVDPWTGEQSILACAARALDGLRFSPPPGGKGTVVARLNFNPRQATR